MVVACLASLTVAGSVLAQASSSGTGSSANPSGTMGQDQSQSGTMGQGQSGSLGAQGAQGQAAKQDILGTVKKVDSMNNLLTLSDGKQLSLDPSSTVIKDGKTATISDIKEGDQVRASFTPPAPTPVHQLTVTSPAAAPSPQEKAPSPQEK